MLLRQDVVRQTEIGILALTMWREARGEGAIGMLAVGCVIANRKKAQGGSYWQHVTARNQFSAMTYKGDSQTIKWPSPIDHTWHEAVQLAESIIDGKLKNDPTNGALFYWNPRASDPNGWFARNIAQNTAKYARTGLLGSHEFFAQKASV